MNVLENFKDLFIDVWKEGISGINISEIFTPDTPSFHTSMNKSLKFSNTFIN